MSSVHQVQFHNFWKLSVAILVIAGCSEKHSENKPFRFQAPYMSPANIRVISGTTFMCNSSMCHLLGVEESESLEVQQAAKVFSEKFFKETGNCISIWNSASPLKERDGHYQLWVVAHDGRSTCLNTALVRNHLAIVNYARSEPYSFSVQGMISDELIYDWKNALDIANRLEKNSK